MRAADTFTFTGTCDEIKNHVRWCRENLGTRGSTWDFSGATKLSISIYDKKLAMFYTLKFSNLERT